MSQLFKPDFIIPLEFLPRARNALPSLFFILIIIRTNSLLFVLFLFQHPKMETENVEVIVLQVQGEDKVSVITALVRGQLLITALVRGLNTSNLWLWVQPKLWAQG